MARKGSPTLEDQMRAAEDEQYRRTYNAVPGNRDLRRDQAPSARGRIADSERLRAQAVAALASMQAERERQGRGNPFDVVTRLADAYKEQTHSGGLKAAAAKAPKGAPDPLDAILAGLPPIDRAAYLTPFDEADAAARAAHAAAVPSIQSGYADLEQRMGATRDDTAAQLEAMRLASEQMGAQGAAELGGRATSTADSLRLLGVDGANLGRAQAGLETIQATQGENAAAHTQSADRIGDIFNQSANSRISDQALAEQAALSNADNTLSATLQRIGLGRAEAEQKFQQDSTDRQMTLADLQLRQQEQAAAQASEQAKAQGDLAKEAQRLAQQFAVAPSQEFRDNYDVIAGKFPKAIQVFEDLTKGTPKGKEGYVAALRRLEGVADLLENGGYKSEATGETFNNQFDLATIRSWLQAYYDDKPRLSAEGQAQIEALFGGGR